MIPNPLLERLYQRLSDAQRINDVLRLRNDELEQFVRQLDLETSNYRHRCTLLESEVNRLKTALIHSSPLETRRKPKSFNNIPIE
jgi:hypothetical protein